VPVATVTETASTTAAQTATGSYERARPTAAAVVVHEVVAAAVATGAMAPESWTSGGARTSTIRRPTAIRALA